MASRKLTFSTNPKLNYVLNDIYNDLKALGIAEIKNSKKLFPREIDYELVSGGNMLIYYEDIRNLYKKAGYVGVNKWSNQKLWDTYKRQVGYMARTYF